jgi:general secretion pathway protein J
MRRANARRGFTLVEMLVAVAIFALAYGGLIALTRAHTRLEAENDRLGRLQFALGLIERDLRSVAARGARDGYGTLMPPLVGARDRIELSRYGLANALELPRAQIERVGYRVERGALMRLRYAVLDRTPGSEPRVDALLDRIESLEWRYLAADGRDLNQWPPPRASDDAPPRAVLLSVRLEDYGEIRRILELPEVAQP